MELTVLGPSSLLFVQEAIGVSSRILAYSLAGAGASGHRPGSFQNLNLVNVSIVVVLFGVRRRSQSKPLMRDSELDKDISTL